MQTQWGLVVFERVSVRHGRSCRVGAHRRVRSRPGGDLVDGTSRLAAPPCVEVGRGPDHAAPHRPFRLRTRRRDGEMEMARRRPTGFAHGAEPVAGRDDVLRCHLGVDGVEVSQVVAHPVVADDRHGPSTTIGGVVRHRVPAVDAADLRHDAVDGRDEHRAASEEDVGRWVRRMGVGPGCSPDLADGHAVRRGGWRQRLADTAGRAPVGRFGRRGRLVDGAERPSNETRGDDAHGDRDGDAGS